jgi:two-component system, OmpR family, sensor histidine kinase VicK
MLTQVISNLLNNANKFTKEEIISITTTKDKDNQEVIVSIQDTGSGIDPEIMPRLFSKFVTKSARGVGIRTICMQKYYRSAWWKDMG